MKTISYILLLSANICTSLTFAQDSTAIENREVYTLNPKIDVPIIAAAGGWSYYALSKIYKKDSTATEDILTLNKK